MLVIAIIFGVLNVCLGFALANYLGYGPAGVHKILNAMDGSPVQDIPHPSTPPFPDSTSPTPATIAESLPESTQESQEIWDLNERYVETSILRLNIAMMKSDLREIQIDNRLRACQGHSDPEVIEDCLRSLREDCLAYLADQKEAADKFHNRISEFGDLSSTCQEIEMANLDQTAQVETTLNNLEFMDYHSNLETANLRLLEEIKNLYMARHKLRDNQEAAFLTVARHENRLDKIEKQLCFDVFTKIRNRIGLETALFDWWRHGHHQARNIMASLLDIDRFSAVNHDFGPMAGNLILYHLAQYLQTSIGKTDIGGRYAGQQFLVMKFDVDSRTALKNVELWRQSIEKMIFLYEKKPIRITVRAALSVVSPNETYLMVLERLENIINQVKQIGPNRTLFYNGAQTAPVESHDMDPQETEIIM
ncbi:MAG: GGDEF domain-containing protein [Thermoguttaceae bacterium]